MNFSNARSGVKKIFMSEIIALIASVLMVIFAVIAMICDEYPQFNGGLPASGIAVLIAFGIYVFAYGLQIFGIVLATKDESAFKVSLYAIIGLLVATVLEAIFHENETLSFVFEITQDAAEFFLVHYIIHGIMHLSEHLERPDMTKKGNRIFKVIYIALAFEVVVRIFEMIFGKEIGEELSAPFGIAAAVLKVVENILFLSYIAKGNKILKENTQ